MSFGKRSASSFSTCAFNPFGHRVTASFGRCFSSSASMPGVWAISPMFTVCQDERSKMRRGAAAEPAEDATTAPAIAEATN